MKRLVLFLICILIIIFIVISLVVGNNNKYIDNLENVIYKNTDIKKIDYINFYDNYYIVMDYEYLYLFDNEFNMIVNIDKKMLNNNYNKYDIVYKDKTLMFMDNYKDKEGMIFKYYDIYTLECIDEIMIY